MLSLNEPLLPLQHSGILQYTIWQKPSLDYVMLAIREPDFDTPEETISAALGDGRYLPKAGDAFYMFPDISLYGFTDGDFCTRIIQEATWHLYRKTASAVPGKSEAPIAAQTELCRTDLIGQSAFCSSFKRTDFSLS